MPEPEPEASLVETAEKLIGVVIRRRWWLLLPAVAVALGTAWVVMLLPNRYTSEATLLVVQQQVPERYVVPTTTTEISEALQGMTQEVLSRTQLMGIIGEFGLYAKEKNRLAPEQIIEMMRKDIGIEPLEDKSNRRTVNGFKISFTAGRPDVAQQVTSRLTSLFIAENLKTREDQAANTARFLQAQLEDAKTKLAEQEKLVRDFKMQHLGELPEQQQGNLAILAGLQTQLQNTAAALSRAQEQRVYLESLLSGYESMAARGVPVVTSAGVSRVTSPLQDAEAEVARLRSERTRLLSLYTSEHPDVIKASREIEAKEALLEKLRASQAPPAEGVKAPAPAAATADSRSDAAVAQVRSQLEANKVEVENLSRDYKTVRTAIERYQERLNQTPVREQQLATVLRDQELLRADYADLLKKKMEAELATSLEKQQAGRQFRLVDAPSLPTVPASPKRVKVSLVGALMGIALGMGIVLFREAKDRSFYSEKAVSQQFKGALVVGIPAFLTAPEKRKRGWRRAAEWVAGTVLVSAVFVTECYVYLHR